MQLTRLPGSLDEVYWDIDGPEETERLAGEFIAAGFNLLNVLQSLAFQLSDEPEAAPRIAKIIGTDKATVEWLQTGYRAESKLHQLIDELMDFFVDDFPENLEPFAATVRTALGTLQEIAAMVERLKAEQEQAASYAANLPDELAKARETIARLQSKNARQRAAIAHMHANHTDPKTLEQLRDANDTLDRLCARLADFSSSKDEIAILHEKLAKTRAQLFKARAEIKTLRDAL